MRLIDADELIEIIEGNENLINWQKDEFINCVNACDTAYDVDKVVEQLKAEKEKAKEKIEQGRGLLIKEPFTPYIKAIEIVKTGGTDEN